ncbi:MAG: mechanosensitive ion channel family protein [Solirubrobacterales bacterium]|nr:mechanosensitive ion channel family protein [Solirubrobacterales bacterium]
MFETRTDAWHRAGLGGELERTGGPLPWTRLVVFGFLTALVLVLFINRKEIFPGLFPEYGTEVRVVTAVLLFAFGWGLAAAFGRTITPYVLRRLDPGTAGTVAFAIRLVSILVIAAIALAIAGVRPETILVGGALTVVVLGLAAQQTLGNVFAGVVLQGAGPYRVGDRVRLSGGQVADTIEGTISSLGLFYLALARHGERVMIPNSVVLGATVVPLHEPEGIDVKARFDSHVSPSRIQEMLNHAITVPTLRPPAIWLEEIDRNEVVVRISATPIDPDDGSRLAEEILSVTRGSFEMPIPASKPDE